MAFCWLSEMFWLSKGSNEVQSRVAEEVKTPLSWTGHTLDQLICLI